MQGSMPFPSENNTLFFKIVALILNPGTFVVTSTLKEKIRAEKRTFPDFLIHRKHDLFHYLKKGRCCMCPSHDHNRPNGKGLSKYQWKILFTKTPNGCKFSDCCCMYSANAYLKEDDLDITLIVFLLVNLFPLSDVEKQNVNTFRDQRNSYYANATKAKMNKNEHKFKFIEVTTVVKKIASFCNIDTQRQVDEEINEIENSPMNYTCYQPIIDWMEETYKSHESVLQEEFEEVVKTLLDEIKDIKKKLQEKPGMEKLEDQSLSQELDEILRGKVEHKINEIKYNSFHGELHKKRIRHPLTKQNSNTFPSRGNKASTKKAVSYQECVANTDSLKEDQKHFLSMIIKQCKTGSLEEIENEISDLPEKSRILRVRDSKGYCAIHYASERNDEDTIQIIDVLVRYGAYITDKTSEGMTVLHIACKNGNAELCKHCLSIDPDILNLEDINGWNASHFAVFYGHRSVLTFLRHKYRNLRIRSDMSFENILHLACLSGNKDLYLHIWKIYPDIIRDEDREGRTIVHYVARGGNIEILKDLLQKSDWVRLEVECQHNTRNILHIACLYGQKEMCRFIMSQFPYMFHETDEDGFHAVHYAAVGGNVSVICLLVEFLDDKVDQFCISKRNNINILQMACVYKRTEMWIFIAKKFPHLLLERDHDNWFIHHAAARCGNLEILKTIIDDNYDIDINSVDKYGRTILHIACLYGKFEVCKFLVSKFPNMAKERDVYGNPACVLAARGGNSDACKLLLGTSNSFLNEEDRKNMSDAANLSKNDSVTNPSGDNYHDASLLQSTSDQTAVSVEEITIEQNMDDLRQTDYMLSPFTGTLESTF